MNIHVKNLLGTGLVFFYRYLRIPMLTHQFYLRWITIHSQAQSLTLLFKPFEFDSTHTTYWRELSRINMTGSIGRLLVIFCYFQITELSNAWTLESPVSFSQKCGRETTKLFQQRSDFDLDSSRRSILGLVPALAGLTLLESPAYAEVDPFAAMDDMLSSGLPTAVSSPASSPTSSQSTTIPNPDKSAPPQTQQNASDMAAALQESKKRRTIDPRTHG